MSRAFYKSLDGFWAMEFRALNALIGRAQGLTDQGRVVVEVERAQGQGGASPAMTYEVTDGLAALHVVGPMVKDLPDWMKGLGIYISQLDLAATIDRAADDPSVRVLMLCFDSPGGTVAGCSDVVDAIARARSRKPVVAYASDLCASCAYWLASQCEWILGDVDALVGSIGIFCVVFDHSEAAKAAGVKVHVLSTGPLKGAGIVGTVVTPEQLAELQARQDALGELFYEAVAGGRGMTLESVKADFGDGKCLTGKKAVAAGLIDGLATADEAFARARAMTQSTKLVPTSFGTQTEGERVMSKKIGELVEKDVLGAEHVTELKALQASAAAGGKCAKCGKALACRDCDPDEEGKKKAKAQGATEARAQALADLKALATAVPGRPAFVMEQFAKGATVLEAQAALAGVLQTELDQARKDANKAKAPSFAASDAQDGDRGGKGEAKEGAFDEAWAKTFIASRAELVSDLDSDPARVAAFARKVSDGTIEDAEWSKALGVEG